MIKMSSKVYYVGDEARQKTIYLPRTRISPKLLELIDKYVRENGVECRSVFIRHALRKALSLSLQDVIDCTIPFLERPPSERQLNE